MAGVDRLRPAVAVPRGVAAVLLTLLLPACGAPGAAPSATAAVDSALPSGQALRRFREGLPEVRELSGGAESREALVRRWVRALEEQDTAALRALVLSPAEFAWLYHPELPAGSPAARMRPEVLWLLVQQNSEKGIVRVVRRLGGRPLGYLGHTCPAPAVRQGASRLWEGCAVTRAAAPGDTAAQRLFGSIVERGGRFKFVSYANGL